MNSGAPQIGTGTFKSTYKMEQAVNRVLQSGQLSYGYFSRQLESKFARLHLNKYGVLSNSGTSSLLVAVQTLKECYDWKDGDEIIVPALTFVATVNVILQSGLKPVLVDVEKDYYGLDVLQIDEAFTDRTRAIMPVHTFGQPANMLGVWNYLDTVNREIYIIEDSCESMFVKHHGTPVGAWSDIACFSTYMAHLITTGVGGISLTNSPEYSKIMRSLVNHGLLYSDLSTGSSFNPVKIHRDFAFERVGHSFRITELEAAIGLTQIEESRDGKDIIEARQKNAAILTENLQLMDLPLQLPKIRPKTEHAFMMYPIILLDGDRDKFTDYLNSRGISTRRMLPLINQPVYRGLWKASNYPVAKWIDEKGFYIGCHQDITSDELDYITEVFFRYFLGSKFR